MASHSASANVTATQHTSEQGEETQPFSVEHTEPGINICNNGYHPEEEMQQPFTERILSHRKPFWVFIVLLVVFNIVVICVSLKATTLGRVEEGGGRGGYGSEGGKEECPENKKVVAPLCVPCEKQMKEEAKEEEEKEEEEGWRRIREEESEEDMCCPLDHRHLASVVQEIYRTVLRAQELEILKQPDKPFFSFDQPSNTMETVLYANRYKPSGHVTGVQPFDAEKFYVPGKNSSDGTQVIGDWPLRVEPYRSFTTGYIQRLSWGLMVPATGLYRVHTSVNFYLKYPQERKNEPQSQEEGIPVIHQITRYRARDRSVSVLTQQNHSISSKYCDGLTSFLVTVADFEIGDVISVSVSHQSALAIRDRWHTEGLFFIQ